MDEMIANETWGSMFGTHRIRDDRRLLLDLLVERLNHPLSKSPSLMIGMDHEICTFVELSSFAIDGKIFGNHGSSSDKFRSGKNAPPDGSPRRVLKILPPEDGDLRVFLEGGRIEGSDKVDLLLGDCAIDVVGAGQRRASRRRRIAW